MCIAYGYNTNSDIGEEYKYKVSHNEIKLYTSVFCICMKYLVSYTEGGT
jgi:hypothetical protein